MMINSLKYKTFFKFLGQIMRFQAKAHPSTLQSLPLNWWLSNWSCSSTFIHSQTLHSLTMEEHNSYVILSLEFWLIFVLTFFRPLGKQQLERRPEHLFLFVVFSWRSWFLKVFVPQQMAHLQPLSMISLHASKSHSSKAPKSKIFRHATQSGHGSTTPVHTETATPITPEL